MDSDKKSRENIVLHKDRRGGKDCIRVDHARSQALASLLAQDADVVAVGDSCAYIPAAAFHLSDFYDRYPPHAYIDYSRVYVRHPKPQREYRPKKWLFEGETPSEQYSASALVKVLKEAADRAGIRHRVHVHSSRYSFATHLLEQGTDLRTIQKLLEHNDIKTTNIYLHVTSTHKSSIPNPLTHWMIREVYLLEMRKCTRMVMFPEANDTAG